MSGISDTEITNLGILVGKPISKSPLIGGFELELELEDPDWLQQSSGMSRISLRNSHTDN
jgi:hypothetical protein